MQCRILYFDIEYSLQWMTKTVRVASQNLNPGQDTRAEPKLEGHRKPGRTQHSRVRDPVAKCVLTPVSDIRFAACVPKMGTYVPDSGTPPPFPTGSEL